MVRSIDTWKRWSLGGLAALAAVLLLPVAALAKAPSTSVFEGYLRAANGAAAPDGDYQVTFRLYEGEKTQSPYWTEGPVTIKVTGGQFSHVLGSNKALDIGVFAAKSENWIELQIGADPAISRQRLHAVAYALSAADVSCTACVSVSEMKFDGDINLGGNALTAGKIVAKEIAGSTISAQKFVGDGSGLTGIKSSGPGIQPSTCTSGQVVVGVNSSGKLICASTASGLPSDGLNKVSNGTLSNNFTDVLLSKNLPVAIPDNAPPGVVDTINVPDLGTAEAFSIAIDVSSSDVSQLIITLIDPNGVQYKLYDKSLKGPALLVSFPPAKPVTGDLSSWVGKNLKGAWKLRVVDTVFLNNGKDGQINKWSVNISTLSNKKVQVNGDLVVTGKIQAAGGGATTFPNDTAKCDNTKKGQVRYSNARGAEICTGAHWVALTAKPILYQGHCQHTRYASGWSYYCLSHTDINTAKDYLTLSTKTPPNGSSSYNSQWQNDSQVGRLTVKIPGYYRVTFEVRARHNNSYWYGEIRVNNQQRAYREHHKYSGWYYANYEMTKILKLKAGDYINAVARTNTSSSSYYAWQGCGSTNCPYGGLRVEYLGHDWN